jgi:hypothetical protein
MRNDPIASDDPEAVAKLTAELAQLTTKRDRMKAVNTAYRKRDLKALAGFGIEGAALEKLDAQVAAAYSWERAPYAKWQVTNLAANCRRIAARIEQLTRKAAELEAHTAAGGEVVQVTELNGATIETDLEEQRVTVRWPARLSREDYKTARSAGFLWSPTRNGFTRKFGQRWQAERLAQAVTSGQAVTP